MAITSSSIPRSSPADVLTDPVLRRRNPIRMDHEPRSPAWRDRVTQSLPLLGLFVGGVVSSVLPRGAFGVHDIAVRAAVTGAAAGMAFLLLAVISRRWLRLG